MEKYSILYMETHCIDVFFAFGEYPIHLLTAGSMIPDALNDILRNRTLQEEIERNESGSTSLEISTNDAYIGDLITRHYSTIEEYRRLAQFQGNDPNLNLYFPEPVRDQITAHFRYYANQGFYSYDCSEVKENGTAVYRMIAWPKKMRPVPYDLPQYTPVNFNASSNDTYPLPDHIEL